ncbi:hypothetical protein THAOC_16440 [Thalassiosira oceanica]|uniref:Uncharacterized protein n=1 Tax=Thalassiosira oceanica TaxID=159749 RepID=K0SPI2_THAOC|nr:hypothetical protein THAOC_16440 [Thalassiosira oceanica]|eukprot:EJK62931.1 hypothetical protein THAOC_16440 [Thalassiosira oceanica]
MQPSKTSYHKGNSQVNKPADLRNNQVKRNYKRRAAGLDQKYAPEVVRDGTNGQVGPFEMALGEFYTGNVFPIVVGAFGEHGKLIKQRRTIIVDTEPDQEPACLAMLGGGRTSSPKNMVCTNSGGMVKTLALSRRQSFLVV